MLQVEYTTQFKKDLKLAKRRNKPLEKLQKILNQIVNEESLANNLKDHTLSGDWNGYRELHIEPDWLLIYRLSINKTKKTVIFVRCGTHSDLFG